jgi:hypothetical protein
MLSTIKFRFRIQTLTNRWSESQDVNPNPCFYAAEGSADQGALENLPDDADADRDQLH